MGPNAKNDLDKTSYLHTPCTAPSCTLTIPQCLDLQAGEQGDKEAYVCRATGQPRQSITFAELKTQTDHLASSLLKLGLRPGSKIILSGISTLDWIVTELAIIKAGLISVRLGLTLNLSSAAAISQVVNYNNAEAILYYPGEHGEHQDFLQKLYPEFKAAGPGKVTSEKLPTLKYFISMKREQSQSFMTIGNLLQMPFDAGLLSSRQNAIESDDIATVTFTAGSEGKPKAVPQSHFNWVNFYLRAFGPMNKPEDRFYNDRSVAWFDSFVHLPVVSGATLVCVRSETTVVKQHAILQLRLMQEERCTSAVLLPYFLQDLVEENNKNQKPFVLDWAIIWGEVVQRDLLQKASNFIKRFEIAYGSAEVMLVARQTWVAGQDLKLGCVGKPVQGVEIKVVNNGNRKLPRGGYGEVCVRSPFAFNMYHNTQEGMKKGIDGWVFTGDYGYTGRDHTLHVLCRRSQLIHRPIAICVPGVVEEVIQKNPAISKVAVFAIPSDRQNIDDVCACVAKKDGVEITSDDLIRFCNDPKESLLSPEVIPKHFLFSASFPNMNGKVCKKTLSKWATDKLRNKARMENRK